MTETPAHRTDPDATSGASDAPGAQLVLFGLPGLAAMLAVIAAGGWLGYPGVVLLASLVAAAGLVARAWAALSLVAVRYSAAVSATRVFPGETVTFQVSIDNAKPLPLSWIEARVNLSARIAPDDPLVEVTEQEGVSRIALSTALGAYRRVSLRRDLDCRKRGYYRIGPAQLLSSDVFGLFLSRRKMAATEPLIVFPGLFAMTDLGLPALQPLGNRKDPRRLFEDPGRPMALRPYTPDTPFKSVAWKGSARTGTLMAKQNETTVSLDTALFLAVDTFLPEPPRQEPGKPPPTAKEKEAAMRLVDEDAFEWAISALASLASHDLDHRRPVGVYANGALTEAVGPLIVPPSRTPGQQSVILEQLARLEAKPTRDFATFLDQTISHSAGRSTLAVIGARFSEDVLERLREQQRRGRPVVALLAGDGPLPIGSVPCRRLGLPGEGGQ